MDPGQKGMNPPDWTLSLPPPQTGMTLTWSQGPRRRTLQLLTLVRAVLPGLLCRASVVVGDVLRAQNIPI